MLLAIDVGKYANRSGGIYQDGACNIGGGGHEQKPYLRRAPWLKLVPLLASEGLSSMMFAAWRWPQWCPRSPWHGARPRIA